MRIGSSWRQRLINGLTRMKSGMLFVVIINSALLTACAGSESGSTPPPPPVSVTLTVAANGTGTVTSNPAGINCGATCTLTVTSGTVVTLTAAPAPNNTLASWNGACATASATCAVTVTSNLTVTATFNTSSANPALTVTPAGTGAGAVTCNGGACTSNYPWGTSVTLSGVPQAGSSFAGWSGGPCSGTADCTVILWADTAITATFDQLPPTAQLTVTKAGTGAGTVTSNPAGITCGGTCAATFNGGEVVTLTASTSAGSTFTGWSGGGCSGTGTCVVTLTADTAVTATFNVVPPTVSLTVTTTGGTGSGSVTCNGTTCNSSYPSGTALTMVATANTTSLFSGWGGACTSAGTTATCNLTLTANTTVTATFNLPTLSVVVAGTGTVTSNPTGINCGATCTASFNKGTSITLTASGTGFGGWSGGGCSGTGTCVIVLNQNTSVTATFGVVSGSNILVSTGATTGTYVDPRIVDDGSGGTIIIWHSVEFAHKLQAQRYNAAGIPQWAVNGIVVCCAINVQTITDVQVATDGAGGAIVVWTDWRRYPSPTDVFAQRVNSAGVIQWGNDGLPIAASDEIEDDPQIIADGAGGGIIAYHRQTQGCGSGCAGAYAQRVTSAGVTQWTTNGVLLSDRSTSGSHADHARLVSDGAGGAIVAWHGSALLSGSQIHAQRVNAAGVPQWTANGIAITDYPTSFGKYTGTGDSPEVAIDGSGGAIIVWLGGGDGSGLRGQRVNSNGLQQWTTNGIIINPLNNGTSFTAIGLQAVSDGASGALLVWSDNRNGSDPDVYAQRVTGAGGIAWAADGVVVGAGLGKQELGSGPYLPAPGPSITPDGASGGIIVWQDSRSITSYDIYAQHLNADGNAQWAANGLAVSTALNDQTAPVITTDGSGGAWMAWIDKRNDPVNNFTADIYAQRVTNAGVLQ